jgi:hypothetical protein
VKSEPGVWSVKTSDCVAADEFTDVDTGVSTVSIARCTSGACFSTSAWLTFREWRDGEGAGSTSTTGVLVNNLRRQLFQF